MFLFFIITTANFRNSTSIGEKLYCAIWNCIQQAFIYKLKWLNCTSAYKGIYVWRYRSQNGSKSVGRSLWKLTTTVPQWSVLQETEQQTKSIIDTVYEGYVSHSVVAGSLRIPHVRHICMLLLLIMLNVRHVYLGPTYMG